MLFVGTRDIVVKKLGVALFFTLIWTRNQIGAPP